jgi:predicted acyl esterase
VDVIDEFRSHPLMDDWYAARSSKLEDIEVPVLSAGNWGGMGLHLRGNVQGFLGAGSRQKWLQMHGGPHWESFYLPEYVQMQKRFFDRFLKDEPNGWEEQPPVMLEVRHPDRFEQRFEHEWPIARTQWTKLYLDAQAGKLAPEAVDSTATASYRAPGRGVEFQSAPMETSTEFTGPLSLVVWIRSSTEDMDLFATVRAYDPDGLEVLFRGATDPQVPVAQGWLRASHRKTDPARSRPGQPFHTHTEVEPLTPGEDYRVEVEVWPTSIVLPRGYRLAVRVDAQDFEREGATGPRKGSGPFLHTDPLDRKPDLFSGENTILTGGRYDSHLMLPLIPSRDN